MPSLHVLNPDCFRDAHHVLKIIGPYDLLHASAGGSTIGVASQIVMVLTAARSVICIGRIRSSISRLAISRWLDGSDTPRNPVLHLSPRYELVTLTRTTPNLEFEHESLTYRLILACFVKC